MYCYYCDNIINKYNNTYCYDNKHYCSKICLTRYLNKKNGTNLILNKWSINNG